MTLRHTVEKIAEGIWAISEFGLVNAYLVEGEDRAMLVDTCIGAGDISRIAADITEKPVFAALTHSHQDHTGGLCRFAGVECGIHEADEAMLRAQKIDNDMRRWYIKTRVPLMFPGEGHAEALMQMLPEKEWNSADSVITVYHDGDMIELGGRSEEIIHTPGHTPGSVCILDRKERILFSGDTVNRSIILMRQPGNDLSLVRDYLNTLKKIWKREKEFDILAIGHGGFVIG